MLPGTDWAFQGPIQLLSVLLSLQVVLFAALTNTILTVNPINQRNFKQNSFSSSKN
jgi:hypothetical protein